MNNATALFARLRAEMSRISDERGLRLESLTVAAEPLTPDEVIGNPEHDDYPLVQGRERMMEARISGVRGQAYTDMYGTWSGTVREACALPLINSFRRAIFVATLNALARIEGLCEDTCHCQGDDLTACAEDLHAFIAEKKLSPPFVLIGYQPRFAEVLSQLGDTRIVDADPGHIGEERAGVRVCGPEETEEALHAAGCVFVTGSTLVNATLPTFLHLPIPTFYYGVTIAGAAAILGLPRFCPRGR